MRCVYISVRYLICFFDVDITYCIKYNFGKDCYGHRDTFRGMSLTNILTEGHIYYENDQGTLRTLSTDTFVPVQSIRERCC